MLKPFVFGIAIWQEQGHRIIDHLKSANFSDSAISAFFPAKSAAREAACFNPVRDNGKAITGSCLGEALSWVEGVHGQTPTSAIPDGSTLQGPSEIIRVGLMAMGIPGKEAFWYGSCIRNGHVLISVHTVTFEDVLLAGEIFRNNGAQDICITKK